MIFIWTSKGKAVTGEPIISIFAGSKLGNELNS
jgi:hypothetical protein